MNREPLSKQRSEWVDATAANIGLVGQLREAGSRSVKVRTRNVHDGRLLVIVCREPVPGAPMAWHLSISFRNHRGEPSRYPSWDEIADARYTLLPDDLTFAMLLPPAGEYVNAHPTTFHLHQL